MNRFAWTGARTVAEAATTASTTVADAMLAPGEASIIKGGGIDLLDLMKEGLLSPRMMVSLSTVPGLDVIAEADGGVRVGSMVTLATLANHHDLKTRYPALTDAVQASASPQIRNVATIGGNLLQRPRCWYFRLADYHCLRKGGGHCFAMTGENQYHAIFDNHACAIVHPSTAATTLVALGAKIVLTGADGAERRVLLEDFFVPPDRDLQRENDLKPHEILRMAHLKQGERESFDWPLADVAVALDIGKDDRCTRAAIVLGAAAPTPHRAMLAQAVLTGKHIDEQTAAEAAHAALDGATPLSKNAYKVPLFETLVRRAILKAVGPG
jgi:xanthine dehydrogenase YagS FAD-binding subunit